MFTNHFWDPCGLRNHQVKNSESWLMLPSHGGEVDGSHGSLTPGAVSLTLAIIIDEEPAVSRRTCSFAQPQPMLLVDLLKTGSSVIGKCR